MVIQGAVSMLLYLLCALERRIVGAEKADILPCAVRFFAEKQKSLCVPGGGLELCRMKNTFSANPLGSI